MAAATQLKKRSAIHNILIAVLLIAFFSTLRTAFMKYEVGQGLLFWLHIAGVIFFVTLLVIIVRGPSKKPKCNLSSKYTDQHHRYLTGTSEIPGFTRSELDRLIIRFDSGEYPKGFLRYTLQLSNHIDEDEFVKRRIFAARANQKKYASDNKTGTWP